MPITHRANLLIGVAASATGATGRDKLDAMFARLLFVIATAPPTTEPVAGSGDATESGFASSTADVIGSVFENLGHNGYQTGFALIFMTAAIIAMLNLAVHRAVLAPVGVGAFWAGWLTWNTLAAQSNPLFPGDVSATKLWDVGLTGDTGFLLVVIVACVAAVFLWRKSAALTSRIMLLVGAILGASFVYNLVEAVRVA